MGTPDWSRLHRELPGPRPWRITRLAAAVATVVFTAAVGGIGLAGYDVYRYLTAESASQQRTARRGMERDTLTAVKWRFIIGAGVGAAVGVGLVVTYDLRKRRREDADC